MFCTIKSTVSPIERSGPRRRAVVLSFDSDLYIIYTLAWSLFFGPTPGSFKPFQPHLLSLAGTLSNPYAGAPVARLGRRILKEFANLEKCGPMKLRTSAPYSKPKNKSRPWCARPSQADDVPPGVDQRCLRGPSHLTRTS